MIGHACSRTCLLSFRAIQLGRCPHSEQAVTLHDLQGEVKCSHCQGTGYRAGWLERGCPVEQ